MLRSARRIARIVALVLLAWTAVDLGNPQCCLAEPLTAAPSGTSLSDGSATTPVAPSPADDCFCCARCLDTGTRLLLDQAPYRWVDFAEPIRHLATRPATLDHPPQNN